MVAQDLPRDYEFWWSNSCSFSDHHPLPTFLLFAMPQSAYPFFSSLIMISLVHPKTSVLVSLQPSIPISSNSWLVLLIQGSVQPSPSQNFFFPDPISTACLFCFPQSTYCYLKLFLLSSLCRPCPLQGPSLCCHWTLGVQDNFLHILEFN